MSAVSHPGLHLAVTAVIATLLLGFTALSECEASRGSSREAPFMPTATCEPAPDPVPAPTVCHVPPFDDYGDDLPWV